MTKTTVSSNTHSYNSLPGPHSTRVTGSSSSIVVGGSGGSGSTLSSSGTGTISWNPPTSIKLGAMVLEVTTTFTYHITLTLKNGKIVEYKKETQSGFAIKGSTFHIGIVPIYHDKFGWVIYVSSDESKEDALHKALRAQKDFLKCLRL